MKTKPSQCSSRRSGRAHTTCGCSSLQLTAGNGNPRSGSPPFLARVSLRKAGARKRAPVFWDCAEVSDLNTSLCLTHSPWVGTQELLNDGGCRRQATAVATMGSVFQIRAESANSVFNDPASFGRHKRRHPPMKEKSPAKDFGKRGGRRNGDFYVLAHNPGRTHLETAGMTELISRWKHWFPICRAARVSAGQIDNRGGNQSAFLSCARRHARG